jgi:purine-binding chemotaxis protein CheW
VKPAASATATQISSEALHAVGGGQQYLTFILASQTYAVPLGLVVEITPNRELNRMPHMPRGVEGILDLRGTVLPVINLRVRLGIETQDASRFENILILELGGKPTGVLVDRVDAVVSTRQEQIVPASGLLAGPDGGWVRGFLHLKNRIISILDTQPLVSHGSHTLAAAFIHEDLDKQLDESLVRLIELAPHRDEGLEVKIIPQMEDAISHTEEEMAKVVDKVEAMLSGADTSFRGLAKLKQEAQLGRLSGEEIAIAEIEKVGQLIQDQIFELLHQLQYQDIARQKLERVLNHIRGMQLVIGHKFKEVGGTHS